MSGAARAGQAPASQAARGPASGAAPAAILIGPPGAGKTTVGGLLAGLLGVGFTDTDAVVEAATGKLISDIFIDDGEAAFRALERAAAAALITGAPGSADDGAVEPVEPVEPVGTGRPGGQVVGLGGGAVLDPGTQALLAGQPVVYLETSFAEAARRIGMDRPRPLMIGVTPRGQHKALLDERLPVYARLAAIKIATDGREPADIAAEAAARLGR